MKTNNIILPSRTRIPDNSNFFLFPLMVRITWSRLFYHWYNFSNKKKGKKEIRNNSLLLTKKETSCRVQWFTVAADRSPSQLILGSCCWLSIEFAALDYWICCSSRGKGKLRKRPLFAKLLRRNLIYLPFHMQICSFMPFLPNKLLS